MNIPVRGKSGCNISIDHDRDVCKIATFSIQAIEKLPGNGYANYMLEYRSQPGDYWM